MIIINTREEKHKFVFFFSRFKLELCLDRYAPGERTEFNQNFLIYTFKLL